MIWKIKKEVTGCCVLRGVVAWLCLYSPGSLAEDNIPVSGVELTDAVQRAVQWHPAISEAIGLMLQQHQYITVANAGYYPQISARLRSGYDDTYPDQRFNQALVLSVSQLLYDFGKVAAEVDIAKAGLQQEKARVLLTIDQIIREVMQAVIEIQRYQQLLQVATDQLNALEKVAALARERHQKGASSRSDLVQSEARIEGAKVLQLQYKAQLQRWRGTLAMLMRSERMPLVTDNFPDQLGACNPSAEIEQSPALLVAQAQRKRAQASIEAAQAQLLPSITLEPSATHYVDKNPLAGSGRDRTQYAVALNFNLPVDQGGAIKARERAAAMALHSADAAFQQSVLAARQQLLEGKNQQDSLQQNLDLLVRRQQLSSDTRDLYREQYLSLGTRPLLDLLNAEQEIHQAQLDRQNTLSDLRTLQTACLFYTGQLRQIFALERSRIQGVELQQ